MDNSREFFDEINTVVSKELFENIQSTYALYTLVKYDFDVLKVQAGIRGELFAREANLISDDTHVKNEYTNVFPSLHFSYQLKEDQTFALGYNRRTWRPALWQVNPIAFQSNEFSIEQGNPALEPEFSNNFDFSYQLEKEKFSISPSLSYRITESIITSQNFVKDGVNVSTYVNNGGIDAYGMALSSTIKPYKWFNSNISFYWNYREFRNDQIGFTRNFSRSASLTVRNQFTISKKTKAILSFHYFNNSVSFLGTQKYSYQINVGIRHKILKDKGGINLRINDIFNSQRYQGVDSGVGFVQNYSFKPVTRVAYLSFSYRIDGGKINQRNKKHRQYKSGVID